MIKKLNEIEKDLNEIIRINEFSNGTVNFNKKIAEILLFQNKLLKDLSFKISEITLPD